jgi:hypothetical protein
MFRTTALLLLFAATSVTRASDPWVVYEGTEGPGKGKHVVLLSGDEEYRSEEGLPQLARILAKHHGFKCTVLFAINPANGQIDPNYSKNIPGMEALDSADLCILLLRFRNLPDEQMQHFVDYLEAGKPIIGMRTATHAFNIGGDSKFARFSWNNKTWDGGFGRQVLGETWINHHGHHGSQGTRGRLAPDQENNPILRGIKDGEIFCTTDVYQVRLPLPGDSQPLVLGEVVAGMKPEDPAVQGKQNDPMMPVAWTKTFTGEKGNKNRIFTTTMGAATDLENEALRRLIVNAAYWGLGMEGQIPEKNNVEIVGEYKPTKFGFGGFKKGVKPEDLRGW